MNAPLWSWAIGAGGVAAGVLLTIPAMTHAWHAGRDHQSRHTPRNLVPLTPGPTVKVGDRVRNAVVQFDLPADLRPEQMAVLRHDGEPERAIAAAMLDLSARGLLSPAGDILGGDRAGISEFQRRLLAIRARATTSFQGRDWALAALYDDPAMREWFADRIDYASYGARLYSTFGFSLALIIGFVGGQLLLEDGLRAAPALAGVVIFFLAVGVAFAYAARRRPVRTATGRALAEQLAGFARAVSASRDGQSLNAVGQRAAEWAAVEMALGIGADRPARLARLIQEPRMEWETRD